MRTNLSILVCMVLLAPPGMAQVQKTAVAPRQLAPQAPAAQVVLRPIPSDMARRFAAFKPALKPSAKIWVEQQALQEAQKQVPDAAVLKTMIRNRFPALAASNRSASGMSVGDGDIEAIAFIVLMQAMNDMEQDLKSIGAQVQAMNNAKQKLRDLMSGINAANAGNSSGASARCRTPFCLSLPSQLKELSVSTRGLQRPVQLFAPADPTFANLSGLQGQMKASLDSLGSLSAELDRRIRLYQERHAKLLEILSTIMKKTSDSQAGIIQNLK